MKKHLNDCQLMIKENSNEIDRYIKQEKWFEKLLLNAFDHRSIDHSEVISAENNSDESFDVEQFKNKLEYLTKKKDEQENKLFKENEYTNSLLNMISNEKSNLKSSEDNYIEYKEKLRKINLTLRNIEQNINEHSNQSKNFVRINRLFKL